jgi:hypothetical protein
MATFFSLSKKVRAVRHALWPSAVGRYLGRRGGICTTRELEAPLHGASSLRLGSTQASSAIARFRSLSEKVARPRR